MLDINSSEDYLMESLKNFMPPQESSMDKSHISALEKLTPFLGKRMQIPTPQQNTTVVAGQQLKNMIDGEEDLQEIMKLENPDFSEDEFTRQ